MDAPLADGGPFKYKFHQMAIYTSSVDASVQKMTLLGYDEWTYDSAKLIGKHGDTKVGVMAFNYQMTPMELEFVCYVNSDFSTRRHSTDRRNGSTPFISHLSTHVEDLDFEVAKMKDLGYTPFHEFTTSQHTNPAIAGKKHFREAIYDTRMILGYDIKLIQRVME